MGDKPTHTQVGFSVPISGPTNMVAQVSVGTKGSTTTAPPTAAQILLGDGVKSAPTAQQPHLTDVSATIGKTLDAFLSVGLPGQSNSVATKWVIAVEGLPYLLTDAPPASAVTAWSGTDYTQALDGLFVALDIEQAINPHEPFENSGGKLTFRVQADRDTDRFGIDTHRRAAGAEAKVTATLNRGGIQAQFNAQAVVVVTGLSQNGGVQVPVTLTQTPGPTIQVDNGNAFVGGDAWIGTECVSLNGGADQQVSIAGRGKYSPFGTYPTGIGRKRFAQHHRVVADSNGVWLNPLLTQQPRTWVGRNVGVYLHKVNGLGVLNSKDDALCVFAGSIASIADDAATGMTVVECIHVLDTIKNTTIGRDMWSASVPEGILLQAGRVFNLMDYAASTSNKQANALTVVASGASGPNQINEDYYSLEEICAFLNTWLGAEKVAGNINGLYRWASPVSSNVGFRTKCYATLPGFGSGICGWSLAMPAEIAVALGMKAGDDSQAVSGTTSISATGLQPSVQTIKQGDVSPLRSSMFKPLGVGAQFWTFPVKNERGTIVDQYTLMPAGQKPASNSGMAWGVFLVDETYMIVGSISNTASSTTITNAIPLSVSLPGASNADIGKLSIGRQADDTNAGDMPIRQLFILDTTFAKLLKYLSYSTGTTNYNHATYDKLGFGLGLNLPGAILGDAFEASIDRLVGAQLPIACMIDKPIKFSDLIEADLNLRRAFLVWRQGHLEFGQWSTPTTDTAVAALGEYNKAGPAGQSQTQRSPTVLTDEWEKNVVKLVYNRDVTKMTDDYQNALTLEDQRSVDDSGGDTRAMTISARNTFTQFSTTGSGIEQLAPGYLALMPMFSQPIRKSTRSIDMRLYFAIAPGDNVIVSDAFMRDPATGLRGVSGRAALVTRVRFDPGGPQAGATGAPQDMQGEVDLVFLDLHRYGAYAPAAEVDPTMNAVGYTAGYHPGEFKLSMLPHAYSEAAEAADYTLFKQGDFISVQEIDAAGTPLMWSRNIVNIVGNELYLNQALNGFTTSRLYRVTYDRYSQVRPLQQGRVFMADAVKGLIENVAVPFEWASTPELGAYLDNKPTDLPEVMAPSSYADGAPMDVGSERGLIRLLNHLADYGTAHMSPQLYSTVFLGGSGLSDFTVATSSRVFLGLEQLTNSVYRYISVRPWIRNQSGNSGQVRITLSRTPPVQRLGGTASAPGSYTKCDFVDQFSQVTWNVIQNQTLYLADAQLVTANVKDIYGYAWITIETNAFAQCRGLGQFLEGPRQTL